VSEDTGDRERRSFLFTHLIAMFETLALQQLGKLVNPVTGEAQPDMRQARITIDMLEMIREKTAGNLEDEEKRLLDAVLTELQLNYIDEAKKGREQASGAEPES
jgi:hypothetical protein